MLLCPENAALCLHAVTQISILLMQQTLPALSQGHLPPYPHAPLSGYLPEPGTGLSAEEGLLPAQGRRVLINLRQLGQFPLLASQ